MSARTSDELTLEGRNLVLRPFRASDIGDDYLGWLNDPEVNRYSRRRFTTTTRDDAERFLASLGEDEHVLAILRRSDGRHVGNIQFGPIDRHSGVAEIRLLVGDRSVWGHGIGTEAIHLVTRHLFEAEGLNRVEANTCNPAFARCVEKLGWTLEGRLRERFLDGGERLDYLWFAILAREFAARPELEA